MKKSIVILGLVLVVLGLMVNNYYGHQNLDYDLTDKELVEMYLDLNCPDYDGYDELVVERDCVDDEYIQYYATSNGRLVNSGVVKESYALYQVTK